MIQLDIKRNIEGQTSLVKTFWGHMVHRLGRLGSHGSPARSMGVTWFTGLVHWNNFPHLCWHKEKYMEILGLTNKVFWGPCEVQRICHVKFKNTLTILGVNSDFSL